MNIDSHFDREQALKISRSCVSFNIRKTARRVGHIYDRAFAELGLKNTQFSVMMGAAIQKEITINRLAEIMGMDRSTLSRNAKLLAGKGFIRLESGSDRREQLISLTDEGWAMLDKAIPVWQKAQSELEEEFGCDWLQGLLAQLREMNRRLP